MPVSEGYLAYAIEQLAGLGRVSSRRMFGGVGLYSGDWFFGLISADILYLKVDDSNRADYDSRGCGPFRPFADRPEYGMRYYQVPAEVLEEPDALRAWAQKSIAVAQRAALDGRAAVPPRRKFIALRRVPGGRRINK
ncbi:MAG TPA: TfoX/Sxy family protein [Steroidobacteraceae bacterium]